MMMRNAHSSAFDFVGGLIVGLMITLSMAAVVRMRRSCS
jgi:hypothetical protein